MLNPSLQAPPAPHSDVVAKSEPSFYAAQSPSHGMGVFARRVIEAGEHIMTFTGTVTHATDTDFNDYHLQVGEDWYLGPSGHEDDLVNHSCEPNAGFQGGLMLIARRTIAAGEEITMDYGCIIDEADFGGFPCTCGAVGCRGMVRSFRHESPAVQALLMDWAMPYLQEKYR